MKIAYVANVHNSKLTLTTIWICSDDKSFYLAHVFTKKKLIMIVLNKFHQPICFGFYFDHAVKFQNGRVGRRY